MLTLHLRVVLFVLNPLNVQRNSSLSSPPPPPTPHPPAVQNRTQLGGLPFQLQSSSAFSAAGSPTSSVQSLLCSNDSGSHLYQASLITLRLFGGGFQQVADGGGDAATLKEERAAWRGGA